MYESFYRLNANPFRLTPDPRYCFSHSGYEQAHAYLQYAFELGEGFILLTGRPGAGKTTLVETFLGELYEGEAVTARVVVSHQETTDLLRSVAYRFGLEAEGLDKATLLKRIADFFIQQHRAGRRALLVIDEAQGLSRAALEELRLLADLQQGAHPLLQIFLVGQEALRSVMREPGMEQFQQRVIGSCRLGPMSLAETRSYVEHRLRRAGWRGDPELTGSAVLALYRYSGGVPRHVNKICTRLLFQGVMENKHKLDKDDVVSIGREMDDEQLSPSTYGSSDVDAAAAEDTAAAQQAQEDPVALAELAVRMEEVAVDRIPVPARMTVARTSKARPNIPQQPRREARPAVRAGSPGEPRIRRTTGVARRDAASQRHATAPVTRRVHTILTSRVLPGVLQMREKPALLFTAVAAVTLSAAVVTSFLGRDEEDGRRALYIRDAQSLQPVSSSTGSEKKTLTEVARQTHKHKPEYGVDLAPDPPAQTVEVAATRQAAEPPAARSSLADVAASGEDGATNARDNTVLALASPPVEPPHGPPADASGSAIRTGRSAAAVASDGDITSNAAAPAGSGGVKADSAVADSQKEKVASLLLQGRQALSRDRLLIPPSRSAYHYFRQVLALEPDNWEALYGMDKILDRYVELTDEAMQRGDDVKARRYIARGLRIRREEPRLLVLRDQLERAPEQIEQTAQTPATVAARVEASPVVQPDKPKNVVDWLKDIFSSNAVGPDRDLSESGVDEPR